ncbi:hypothetical protein BJX68DRAFT_163947 [Aspergillus pseudodeflectus]|uniref:Uncharacterized protein n=1 Tax=Aspergillus pseudodeflectus TaxID=176178 RepID=A0ABR4L180_9EURO
MVNSVVLVIIFGALGTEKRETIWSRLREMEIWGLGNASNVMNHRALQDSQDLPCSLRPCWPWIRWQPSPRSKQRVCATHEGKRRDRSNGQSM